MRGVFDDREVQQAVSRPDTELTLSSTTLLLIFFGLVLLCGLCFGLGYSTGHRGSQETAATFAAPPAGQAPASEAGGDAKPMAQAAQSTAPQSPAGDQQAPEEAGANLQAAAAAPAGGVSNGQPQVRPALTDAANPALAGQTASGTVGPALGASSSLMVQIAAVSQPEDADVLMTALRKRGYAVGAHREPLDGLIHVRIGPFKTRDEAEKWRQKLLNDGYNAIVQP